VGRASAFFCLLEFTVPGLVRAFSAAERTTDAYPEDLAPVDFSHQVLSRSTAQLLVVRMAASVGWSDLGEADQMGIGSWQAEFGQMMASETMAAVV
jgi:hypothetical protein